MGLLDTINNKLAGIQTNPLKMGLLAYGMTGQGHDPTGSAVQAMFAASQAKAKQDELARQKAQQAQIASMFAGNSIDPATLAQYSMGGGEGAKELLDMYKFGRTPQSVAPGQMMIDPTTGKMSMPAPKMGEGQMWDGQQVTSAPGYLQAYGAQKAVDAQNAIDQYAAQQGIGYQYDLGRMGQQNRYDLGKLEATQGYDWQKMQAQNQFDIDKTGMQNQYDWQKMQAQNQFDIDKTGMQNQYDWQKMERQSGLGQQAKRSEEAIKADQTYTTDMRTQASKNATLQNQLSTLKDLSGKIEEGKVGALRSYIGSFAPGLGIDPTIDDKQQFEAIINGIIPTLRVPGSGGFSDNDAKMMEKSLPQLSGTAEGRAKILSDLQDKVDMQAAEAQAMEDYIAKRGALDDNYYRMRNEFYKAWGR